jgi:hypothetical protein
MKGSLRDTLVGRKYMKERRWKIQSSGEEGMKSV